MKRLTTTDQAQRRAESQAAAVAARRAAQGTTPTIVYLRRVLRDDARMGHASSVAAAAGVCAC